MSTLKQLEDAIFEAGPDGGQVTSEAIDKFKDRATEFKQALTCWYRSILLVITSPHDCLQHSFKDLAHFYARRYEIPPDTWEQVSEWFNWDAIVKELK